MNRLGVIGVVVALGVSPGVTAAQHLRPASEAPVSSSFTPELFPVPVAPGPTVAGEDLPLPSDYGRAVAKGAALGGAIGLAIGLVSLPGNDNAIFGPVGLLIATTGTGVVIGAGLATLGYLSPPR